MANARTLPLALARMFNTGFASVKDPGDGETISWTNQGLAIARIVTAGAESRALPSFSSGKFGIGTILVVVLDTDGGDLTLTGSDRTIVLEDAGDTVVFVVTASTSAGVVTYSWTVLSDTREKAHALIGGGAPAASGLVLGGGTSADPITTDVAGAKFIELRTESTATSGDNRSVYLRHALSGAGGGGECIRAFTKLAETVGTARGAHISLDYDDTPEGQVTGLGVGVDAQLLLNGALSSGTHAVVNAEIFTAAAGDPAGNNIACFRAVNNGAATDDVDDDAAIFAVDGFTAANGTAHAVSDTSLNELPTGTIGLRATIDGAVYYIPAVLAAQWN